MADKEKPQRLRMELTPEQQARIRSATGKDVASLRLTLEELEMRLAPGRSIN
jgi:hypothetical protein